MRRNEIICKGLRAAVVCAAGVWVGSAPAGEPRGGRHISPGYRPVIHSGHFGGGHGSYGGPWRHSTYPRYYTGSPYATHPIYVSPGWSPSTRYRLVEVSPELEAARRRVDLMSGDAEDNAYRAWQRDMVTRRQRGETPTSEPLPENALAKPAATAPSAVVPKPASEPAAAPPQIVAPIDDGWAALRDARYLEAHSVFAGHADSAESKAAASIGFAVSAVMLDREESAAWAVRRAMELDAGILAKVPADAGILRAVEVARGRVAAIAEVQPTPDRTLLLNALGELVRRASP